MKYIFVLSGENLELAEQEVLALASAKSFHCKDNLLLVDCKKFRFSRLAFCHKVLKFVFEDKNAESIDWNKHCKGSFCVRFKGKSSLEPKIASVIWKSLKEPKVDLKNPDTKVEFVESGNKVYCGISLFENTKQFLSRATKHKPGFHPSSMNPKLARACVNLSGIKDGIMLDPFCGAAGMLVEAALMGIKVIGSDIDENMLRLAKKNLKHYKVRAKLIEKDALNLKLKADAIVTDMPYGRSSSLHKKDAEKLYNSFLKKAKQLLKKKGRIVMVVPSKAKLKHSFKTVAEIDHYVHHTLTRRIHVLEN
ncbi:MAG: DNA methyltransferase [Candidatus Woesearchaeota archaeon]